MGLSGEITAMFVRIIPGYFGYDGVAQCQWMENCLLELFKFYYEKNQFSEYQKNHLRKMFSRQKRVGEFCERLDQLVEDVTNNHYSAIVACMFRSALQYLFEDLMISVPEQLQELLNEIDEYLFSDEEPFELGTRGFITDFDTFPGTHPWWDLFYFEDAPY